MQGFIPGGTQTQKQSSLGQILKQQTYGMAGMDRQQMTSMMSNMRLSNEQKYANNQLMQ